MGYKDRKTQLEAQKKHYQDNKERYKKQLQERRRKNREYVWSIKEQSSCSKCGESHPACLDFHHPDDVEKENSIARAAVDWGLTRIKKEIAKCIILCANCHRKHHFELRQSDV